MDSSIDLIFHFLSEIAKHNNREWFAEHKEQYEAARQLFEHKVQLVIDRISLFDPDVQYVRVKDCTFRFYRDVRFSEDKSPYKLHFGAYINPHGKKSFHSGYYLHIQPDSCMLAGGSWCLPSPILNAVRHSVADHLAEFRKIVEYRDFKTYFPLIGDKRLKTLPKGFSKDFPYPEYIRPKDYSVCHYVSDDFFRQDGWLENVAEIFRLLKPFNDFINTAIDEME